MMGIISEEASVNVSEVSKGTTLFCTSIYSVNVIKGIINAITKDPTR
jgi:hypothetical protein